jgi:hypothetical protein
VLSPSIIVDLANFCAEATNLCPIGKMLLAGCPLGRVVGIFSDEVVCPSSPKMLF